MILCSSSESTVMFPLSFLTLLIWIFSFCLLVSLKKSLSICWFSWRSNSLFQWFFVFFCCCSFIIDFNPQFVYFFSCCLLLLGESASICSRAFRHAVKTLEWDLCKFFMEFVLCTFRLNTYFTVPCTFGFVVSSFPLNSRKSLTSLFLLPWPMVT